MKTLIKKYTEKLLHTHFRDTIEKHLTDFAEEYDKQFQPETESTNFIQTEPFTREYLNLDKETIVTLLMNCQKVLEGMNQNNYCTCKNDHYAYGHAVCFDCGKIKECRNHVPVDDPVVADQE